MASRAQVKGGRKMEGKNIAHLCGHTALRSGLSSSQKALEHSAITDLRVCPGNGTREEFRQRSAWFYNMAGGTNGWMGVEFLIFSVLLQADSNKTKQANSYEI
jgi:hypothetical protein